MKLRSVTPATFGALLVLTMLAVASPASGAVVSHNLVLDPAPSENSYTSQAPAFETSAALDSTAAFTISLPALARKRSPLVYQWLVRQQIPGTGLLPSQQDNAVNTYNNALAVMVFTLHGDHAKSKAILDFFDGKADEFYSNQCDSFQAGCSQLATCESTTPCGFFQARDATTGEPFPDANRWMGDMAWLAMAIHHYQAATGDATYDAMARAIVKLLKSWQQPDGYVAVGWEWEDGNPIFVAAARVEGNLNAYKAFRLYGETTTAEAIKGWLDHTDLDWNNGPLDIHSWRVLALGKEYGYSLADMERTDAEPLRYRSTVTFRGAEVTGFLPMPAALYSDTCKASNNIWAEGTGQMAVAWYKAGYRERGDFYARELRKLLFEPAGFPGFRAISFLSLPLPAAADPDDCPTWLDTTKGHVAAVAWHILAEQRFDPFDGVTMHSFQAVDPRAKIEAENYVSSSGSGVRLDGTGELSGGNAAHLGGDEPTATVDMSSVEYKFYLPSAVDNAMMQARYADDVAGDAIEVYLDGVLIGSFATVDTGTWDDYTTHSFAAKTIASGLHTLKIHVVENDSRGCTVDYLSINGG